MQSSNLRLDKRRKTYVRLMGEIKHALSQALTEEFKARKLTRKHMADLLGVDKSFITRKLSGEENMTLETLSDLAFTLDRPVRISLPSRHVAISRNDHPNLNKLLNEELKPKNGGQIKEVDSPTNAQSNLDKPRSDLLAA